MHSRALQVFSYFNLFSLCYFLQNVQIDYSSIKPHDINNESVSKLYERVHQIQRWFIEARGALVHEQIWTAVIACHVNFLLSRKCQLQINLNTNVCLVVKSASINVAVVRPGHFAIVTQYNKCSRAFTRHELQRIIHARGNRVENTLVKTIKNYFEKNFLHSCIANTTTANMLNWTV